MKYKQFDEYMYLRILWCRTGCESACQQSTYNLKREQFFFFIPLTICTIGTMMNQYLSFFFFCQTFVELYLFKRKKFCLWQIEIIIESNLIKRKNSFELMKRLFFIHYIIRSLFFFFRRKI